MESNDLRDMTFGALFNRLTEQLSRLLRQEFALAQNNLFAAGRRAARAVLLLTVAGIVGLFALVALTFAAVSGLALVMPMWGAALVVTGFYAIVALICLKLGIQALHRISQSRNPIASLEEDLRWVKMRAKSAKP